MTRPKQAALANTLQQLGVPADKAPDMATQLDKRARQLAQKDGRTYPDALMHLLQLMKTAHEERSRAAGAPSAGQNSLSAGEAPAAL